MSDDARRLRASSPTAEIDTLEEHIIKRDPTPSYTHPVICATTSPVVNLMLQDENTRFPKINTLLKDLSLEKEQYGDDDTDDDDDDEEELCEINYENDRWPLFPSFIDSGTTIQNLLYAMGVEVNPIIEDGIKLTVGIFMQNEQTLRKKRCRGKLLHSPDVKELFQKRAELRRTLNQYFSVISRKY